MTKDTLNDLALPFSGDDWFDPLEEAVRQSIRGFIEEMLDGELDGSVGEAHKGEPAEGIGESTVGRLAQSHRDVGQDLVCKGVDHGPRQVGALAACARGRQESEGEDQGRQTAPTQAEGCSHHLRGPHDTALV